MGDPDWTTTCSLTTLDPLTDTVRLILVDQRANGRSDRPPKETCTLEQSAQEVRELSQAMQLGAYAVLGHSYGAFVALQHAVDYPDGPDVSIISSGVPGTRFLSSFVDAQISNFQPEALRQQVKDAWAQEENVQTQSDVATSIINQLPFHLTNPLDPRISEYVRRTADMIYSPEVLRKFSSSEYGGIEIENLISGIRHPVLILAGRHDRTCSVQAAEFMRGNIPDAELIIFEKSGHMTFVEENELYLSTVRNFLKRHVRL